MTTTTRKPRVKPSRKANVTRPNSKGERILTLTETTGTKVKGASYYLTLIPSDFGTGYRLEKFAIDGGDVYEVNLSADGNTCCCLGHLRHGHKTVCKHIASLTALTAAGKLS